MTLDNIIIGNRKVNNHNLHPSYKSIRQLPKNSFSKLQAADFALEILSGRTTSLFIGNKKLCEIQGFIAWKYAKGKLYSDNIQNTIEYVGNTRN